LHCANGSVIQDRYSEPIVMLGGIVLNNCSRGVEPLCVEHATAHGSEGCLATNTRCRRTTSRSGGCSPGKAFPKRRPGALAAAPYCYRRVRQVRDELKHICDIVATHDLVLSAGHVHKDEASGFLRSPRKER